MDDGHSPSSCSCSSSGQISLISPIEINCSFDYHLLRFWTRAKAIHGALAVSVYVRTAGRTSRDGCTPLSGFIRRSLSFWVDATTYFIPSPSPLQALCALQSLNLSLPESASPVGCQGIWVPRNKKKGRSGKGRIMPVSYSTSEGFIFVSFLFFVVVCLRFRRSQN